MNKDENEMKLEILRKKVFPTLTPDELREKKWVEINLMLDFDSDEDLDLLAALPKLESLDLLYPTTMLKPESYQKLAQIPTLRRLNIRDVAYSDEVLEVLCKIRNIEELTLTWRSFGSRDLKALCGQTHLKALTLDFTNKPLPESVLDVLKTLPQLEKLTLGRCKFSPEQLLDVVKDFPNLHHLEWEGQPLTEEGTARLLAMKNLDSLCVARPLENEEFLELEEDLSFLDDGPRFKELKLESWKSIWNFDWDLPNLERLEVAGLSNLRSIDFSRLPSIQHLDIELLDSDSPTFELKDLDSLDGLKWFKYCGPRLETSIFRQLEMIPRLEVFLLDDQSPLEPEDVQCLSSLKRLRKMALVLSDDLTVADVEKIEPLPCLHRLMVSNVKSPEILEALLKKLPALCLLHIFHTHMGDEEIRILSHFPNIRGLEIFSCLNASEEGIQNLFAQKNLRQIELGFGKLEKLEVRDMPNLRELRFHHWWSLKELKLERIPKLWSFFLTSPKLESICFRNLDEIGAIGLQNCCLLESVSIGYAPKLIHLNLIGSDCQDLTSLVALPNLTELALTYHQMRQELVLETLQELPKLNSLYVDCTPQDEDADANFPRYVFCHETLDDCPFTKPERDRVQKALPNCEIEYAF